MADKTSPKVQKTSRPPPSHPKTYDMVLEALGNVKSSKGVSVPATKTYILEKYPNVDPLRLKALVKKAFAKGLKEGTIIRPKGSDELGGSMTGRFKLATKAEPEKAKKPKKNTEKKVEDKKPKKKTLAKTTSRSKSPKAKAIKELTKAKKSPKKKVAAAATKKSPKKALKKAEKATGKATTKPKTKNLPQKAKKTSTPSQKTAKARVKNAKNKK